MSPAPNDDRPSPSTPLRLCGGWYIRAACSRCRRVSVQSIADIAGGRAGQLPLRRVAARMRCGVCGSPPEDVRVVSHDEGMRETGRAAR